MPTGRGPDRGDGGGRAYWPGVLKERYAVVVALAALTQVPVVSAHGGGQDAGLSEWHGLAVSFLGLGVLGGAVLLKRRGSIPPRTALAGTIVGLTLATVGTILFDGLIADPAYTARSIPFPRAWYPPLALLSGLLVAVASFAVGWFRWPTRPRYTVLGVLMGTWISYPYLIPGMESYTNPLGYLIVLATPVTVGYIVWRDAGDILSRVFQDRVARRFGIGVGFLVGVFFMSMSGYISFFLEEGAPHETTVAVLPVVYQLVSWPTLEVALPQIPLFVALSPGIAVIVGLLSVLIGLNAAVIARHWRVHNDAGVAQGTAGTATIVGSCTCGCCGPLVAKVAILAAGPSIAAPLYWVFVDSASPLSSVFIVASVLLFTGSLVYSVESTRSPDQPSTLMDSADPTP